LAIALNECIGKRFAKITQTMMILPTFISWIAVTFIVTSLLDVRSGMLNNVLAFFGKGEISWYTESGYWPYILLIVNVWKSTGYGSIIYLSALAGMDQDVFEAANLDGASKLQQIRYITLPMLTSMVCILTLMSLGGIMSSNTGLFYQVTRNVGSLYSTTQTIDAYVMNALMSGTSNFGMTAAVSFFQSVVGCFMVLVVNMLVKKWEPENSLF
jgi:multiple sugar transport system permease protein/putative aldouronate transport system permease protein